MDQAVSGPRLVVTGPIPSSPGGHPATTVCDNPFCRQLVAREVENEAQARQAVRELVRAKVNAVKVVIDDLAVKGVPPLSDATVATLVEETHRSRLRIIAHVSLERDVEAVRRLAELGLDEFVHLPHNFRKIPDPADVSQMAAILVARKLPVTTTVSFSDSHRDAAGVERTAFGSPYTPAMRQTFEGNLNVVRAFADAGVKLVVGTDWFNGPVPFDDARSAPGAQTLHEMELLRRAGLSTSAILTAATRNAAEALGILDKVGTIAEGKLADLVVLDGDLLQDFSTLHRTVAVLKGGRIAHGALSNR
jgi:enamidase